MLDCIFSNKRMTCICVVGAAAVAVLNEIKSFLVIAFWLRVDWFISAFLVRKWGWLLEFEDVHSVKKSV